ncbi:MAG TPA: hypothetical protein VFQ61_11475 [Polyangiaceae bacterium]|nr:hypothetical protein [Polyangiaceae bacterium]
MKPIGLIAPALLATLSWGCGFESRGDGQLRVELLEPAGFYADGMSRRIVRVSFEHRITAGKPLRATTSLGIINPAADDAGTRRLELQTSHGSPIDFVLYAEQVAGVGRITVEGPGGLRQDADFVLEPVNDELSILVSAGPYIADGAHETTLTIGLTSGSPAFRDVLVKTSHGILSPDKANEAARARTVRVAPNRPRDLTWILGNSAGNAVVSAELGNVLETEIVQLDQALRDLTIGAPESALADDQTVVPILLDYAAPLGELETVTLTTTLGELNAAGTTPEERRTKRITVRGQETALVNLSVGRQPGPALLTAHSGTTPDRAVSLWLQPALPDRIALELLDGSVLDSSHSQLQIRSTLTRDAGRGLVSAGTTIWLHPCCEIDSGSLEDCTRYLAVPSFVQDVDGDGRESAIAALTPAGTNLVQTAASGQQKNVAVTLFAFVMEEGSPSIACTDWQNEPPRRVAAWQQIALALARPAQP